MELKKKSSDLVVIYDADQTIDHEIFYKNLWNAKCLKQFSLFLESSHRIGVIS